MAAKKAVRKAVRKPAAPTRRAERRTECQQLVKLSKHVQGTLELLQGEPCSCRCDEGLEPQTVYKLRYRGVLPLRTAERLCDKSNHPLLLPDGGVEAEVSGELTLREDRCPADNQPILIGANHGKWVLRRIGGPDLFKGTTCGTDGVNPTAVGPARCCAPGEGFGSSCGVGVGPLAGWTLWASFHSRLSGLMPEQLCQQPVLPVQLEVDLDGVLIGPCAPIEGQRPQRGRKR
jgi:hypothetical protein